MKDQSRYHACANGNDCASPPIRQDDQGEHPERGQQTNFYEGFHLQNVRLEGTGFPVLQSPFKRGMSISHSTPISIAYFSR